MKGRIEPVEAPMQAAARELREEAGIDLDPAASLGAVVIGSPPVRWTLVRFDGTGLPPRWRHRTGDGGGLTFRFGWHPLSSAPDRTWHPAFRAVLREVRRRARRAKPLASGPRRT